MADYLVPPRVQFFDTDTQQFLVGGKLYAYAAGTMTPIATYPTPDDRDAETNAHTHPIILDARGEAAVVLSGATKLILKDPDDNIIWTADDVQVSTADIIDVNGNEVIRIGTTAFAVNEITVTNAATTGIPIIAASGDDVNVSLKVTAKGSGDLLLDGGTTGKTKIGSVSSGDIEVESPLVINDSVNIIPAGMVMWRASTTVPTGWLECDGSAVSRATYAALFAAIGTTWGVGDGSTTFNLPNQARRAIVGKGGSGSGTLAATVGSTGGSETQALTGPNLAVGTPYSSDSTVGINIAGGAAGTAASVTTGGTWSFGTGTAHNNMQPSMVMMMLIKAI